jgi:hypothetical protein
MAISQTWSDDRLLSIAAEVQDYFSQAPSKPDVNRGEWLYGELERLKEQDRQLRDRVNQQRKELKTLGPARSWKDLFGSDPQKVRAAEQRLGQTTSQKAMLGRRIQTTQETFRAWQQEARTYIGWRDSEKGEQMHQYRDILKLEPVQERITQIHQAQEQIRQAQEQQRQKEKALEALQGWKQMAIKLGRPQTYVQRIQAITEEYRQGKPLNENQHERMKQDLTAYQEQLRQAQVQQQRSPRMGGFSL